MDVLSEEQFEFLLTKWNKNPIGYAAMIGQACNRKDNLGAKEFVKVLQMHLEELMAVEGAVKVFQERKFNKAKEQAKQEEDDLPVF